MGLVSVLKQLFVVAGDAIGGDSNITIEAPRVRITSDLRLARRRPGRKVPCGQDELGSRISPVQRRIKEADRKVRYRIEVLQIVSREISSKPLLESELLKMSARDGPKIQFVQGIIECRSTGL
jgi:hypothetical protein